MGRPQHRVRNNVSGSLPLPVEDVVRPLWSPCWVVVRFHSRGGREDEQARQSGAEAVVLMLRDMFYRLFSFLISSGLLVVPNDKSARPQPQP